MNWKINLKILGAALLLALGWTVSAQGDDLLGRINNLRASKGLPGYSLNGSLSAAAQSQAQWMVDTGMISHSRPDGSTPRSRAAAYGYPTLEVSENIYGGTNATVDSAWTFWINSGVHYAGLVNTRYKEVGIGVASSGWGRAYVLVFGNPGGPAYVPPAPAGSGGGAPEQPSFVVGLDPHGNIMHEVQPGDTLGDIALIYGYTWDDIPYMLELNHLSQTDIRELEVGSVFLVPPQDGTYTPTPGDPPTATPAPSLTSVATETPFTPEAATAVFASPTAHIVGATLENVPQAVALLLMSETPSPTLPSEVTAAPSGVPASAKTAGVISPPGASPWLAAALVVQAGILVIAGVDFIRRKRRS